MLHFNQPHPTDITEPFDCVAFMNERSHPFYGTYPPVLAYWDKEYLKEAKMKKNEKKD